MTPHEVTHKEKMEENKIIYGHKEFGAQLLDTESRKNAPIKLAPSKVLSTTCDQNKPYCDEEKLNDKFYGVLSSHTKRKEKHDYG